MSDSTCHCCGAVLPEADAEALRRCAACGAPQVRISEELRAQAAAEREQYEERLTQGSAHNERPPGEVRWDKVIGLSAACSAAAVALCALVPSLVTAACLVPFAVVIAYRMRLPRGVLTPLAGARIGAVVGLFFCTGAAVAGTIYLGVRRFGHSMNGFDTFYADALAAAEKQAVAQNGPGAAMSFGALGRPEFRAGMLLLFALLASAAFVLLCVTSGAISAAAQQRRVPRVTDPNEGD